MAEEIKAEYKRLQDKKRAKNKENIEVDEFEWIQLNKELAVNRDTGKKHQEASSEKLVRKFKENPFLPIGCGATTFFLVNGLFKFGRKDSEGSQVAIQIGKWSEFTGTFFLQKMMNRHCLEKL